jgi:negative regulator of flagellin synthesis FlgM
MKINNSIGSTGAPVPKETATRPTANGGASAGAPANSGSSEVQLSALSSQLQSAQTNLASVPVVNQAQVNEIKQAISEGRFKVNPEVVADRLIDTVRELIRNKAS